MGKAKHEPGAHADGSRLSLEQLCDGWPRRRVTENDAQSFAGNVLRVLADRAYVSNFGGTQSLIRFHVWWGLAWAAIIVPIFLMLKHGPRHVLEEIRVTRDDLAWLVMKPFAMAGLAKQPLPPQDKYNAGQKLFAVFVLAATTTIIASGLAMTFHLGPPPVVASAILVHKLSIALVLAGLAIHVTMAAVIADERPALKSMITGRIDYEHAKHHSPKWVAQVAGAPAAEQKEE